MSNLVQRSVQFYGDDLAVIRYEGVDYAPVKPVCDILGIDWEGQRQRIERDEVLRSTAVVLQAVGADGRQRDMTCLPLEMFNGWLFGVSSGHIRPENRETLIRYKRECYRALARAFGDYTTPPPNTVIDTTSARLAGLEARVAALEAGTKRHRPKRDRPRLSTPSTRASSRHDLPLRMIAAIAAAEACHQPLATMRLASACGIARTNAATFFRRLSELRAGGYVAKEPGKCGRLTLTDAGRALLSNNTVQSQASDEELVYGS